MRILPKVVPDGLCVSSITTTKINWLIDYRLQRDHAAIWVVLTKFINKVPFRYARYQRATKTIWPCYGKESQGRQEFWADLHQWKGRQ